MRQTQTFRQNKKFYNIITQQDKKRNNETKNKQTDIETKRQTGTRQKFYNMIAQHSLIYTDDIKGIN